MASRMVANDIGTLVPERNRRLESRRSTMSTQVLCKSTAEPDRTFIYHRYDILPVICQMPKKILLVRGYLRSVVYCGPAHDAIKAL